ncbi:MAG: cofactor-independent phosphoglycerate mutase [Cellulosilyticaceae bacterium]
MKYVVVLADGMADEKRETLGGKTPLEYANTPHMDRYAPYSEIGMVHTIPKGCAKGSDTANLSVLGYNPQVYYFGRSPLEALSMGVSLKDTDITFRTNVVTLSEEEDNYEDKKILDHSADEITTEEAKELIEAVAKSLGDDIRKFYAGVSYRHLLVWDKGSKKVSLTPPHDILDRRIGDYKPEGDNSHILWEMMEKSYAILNHHPVNEARRSKGLRPANSIWIWGEGSKPLLPSFKEKYGVEGAVISAVDLIKGIGIGAEMTSIDVEGATGNVHTNYEGKAQAAIKWLIEEDKDFVYIHLEGPDESGHRGEEDNKIKSIELIDQKVIGPVASALEAKGLDYKLMVLPDHPTPLSIRTHTDDPVPYMIYQSTNKKEIQLDNKYTESHGAATGNQVEQGYLLMQYFLS